MVLGVLSFALKVISRVLRFNFRFYALGYKVKVYLWVLGFRFEVLKFKVKVLNLRFRVLGV
jgi:hypothetical protein